jgi:TolB-like protein
MAFALLLIGLPVVVATAAVQGGLPGLRMVDLVDPNELEGLTPEQVHVIPEAHPLHGWGLFTWRNAILGGVMAAALLVTSVVSYLSMWALGIGPVGSLVAQGIIVQDDVILVAPFENLTDDADLGREVARALREELSNSSLVQVLDSASLAEALDAMGRPNAALTPTLAMEAAVGTGAKAVIDGGVSRERGRYRVHARLLLVEGTALARFEEAIADGAGLADGVAVLAARLRERLGEPLRVINAPRRGATAGTPDP